MYIPNATPADATFSTTFSSSHEANSGGWSSLIGIITAICGNILISFALNTQRYAHMRLGQARDESEKRSKLNRKRGKRSSGVGVGGATQETTQQEIAEARAKKNAESRPDGGIDTSIENGEAERQPLIPKLGDRKESRSTNETYVDDEKEDDARATKSYLRSPVWWLGISMMVVGEAGNFLAYGFAPASIVSPLGVVALISNCLIAPLLLHEKFRIRDGLGVIIAVMGCVTVVLSASGSNPKLDPDDIWDLIARWEFETYLGITISLIILLMVASNRFGEKSVLVDLGLVGLFGGYTVLSTKGVASLLSNTIWRVVTFPLTYLLLAILVFTAVMQIKYVNRALQRFNSTIVIPTQFVLFTISVILGSAILYRDFERTSAADAGKFLGGCALTFLGVWCITSGRSDSSEGEDISEADEEDVVELVDEEEIRGESRKQDGSHADHSSRSAPPVRRTHTAEDLPSPLTQVLETHPEEGPSLDPKATLHLAPGPANRSSIHISSTAEIRPSKPDSRKPPAVHATTSAPIIPTFRVHDNSLRPHTPIRRAPSDSASPNTENLPPHIADRLQPDSQNVYATHGLLSRHSIVDLIPGPLTSPLSSSLSAIVADSLRRGVDRTPSSTFRRRSIKFGRRKTGTEQSTTQEPTMAKRHSITSGELNSDGDREDAEAGDVMSPNGQGRGRSFSATVSEIFGSAMKRHKSGDASAVGR